MARIFRRPGSAEGLRLKQLRILLSRLPYVLRHGLRGGLRLGWCPICQRPTVFCKEGDWLRDQYKCVCCRSIPRWRAIVAVLERFFPNWRELKIHESSPSGAASEKLARECPGYLPSHWFPNVPLGVEHHGYRCEDLERQTFQDATFDLVVTQDVFEHVLDPARGFAEVARTLKPGGAHVFTVPWYYWKPTLIRASRDDAGSLLQHAPADYHGNPIDSQGSLVVTEWGEDLCDFVFRVSGLVTTAVHLHDPSQGIEAKFIEVFLGRKTSTAAPNPPLG